MHREPDSGSPAIHRGPSQGGLPGLISRRKCPCPEMLVQKKRAPAEFQGARRPHIPHQAEGLLPSLLEQRRWAGSGWGSGTQASWGAAGFCILGLLPAQTCAHHPSFTFYHLHGLQAWGEGVLRSHSQTPGCLYGDYRLVDPSPSSLAPLGLCTGCHPKVPPGCSFRPLGKPLPPGPGVWTRRSQVQSPVGACRGQPIYVSLPSVFSLPFFLKSIK